MYFSKCLLVLSWVTCVRLQAGTELQHVPRAAGFSVLVNSARNKTGFWTTRVTLGHDNSEKSQSALSSVEVEPKTSSCVQSKSKYDVTLTIISKPTETTIAFSSGYMIGGMLTFGVLAGYEPLPGLNNYKFHNTAATWPSARVACEQEGGHLVVINSEEESQAMMKLYKQNPTLIGSSHPALGWIGMRESETTNGQFFTIFGESLVSTGFSRWDSGQNDSTALGDFVWIHLTRGGLGDQTVADNFKLPFFCEQSVC